LPESFKLKHISYKIRRTIFPRDCAAAAADVCGADICQSVNQSVCRVFAHGIAYGRLRRGPRPGFFEEPYGIPYAIS